MKKKCTNERKLYYIIMINKGEGSTAAPSLRGMARDPSALQSTRLISVTRIQHFFFFRFSSYKYKTHVVRISFFLQMVVFEIIVMIKLFILSLTLTLKLRC